MIEHIEFIEQASAAIGCDFKARVPISPRQTLRNQSGFSPAAGSTI
jgi:hypothetical protein